MSDMPRPTVPPASTPPPPPPAGAASSDRSLMLVLSYLSILAVIPLLTKKEDREIQWHAKNGLVLTAAFVILSIGWAVINHFMPASLGCALSFVSCALWIGWLALAVMGMMKAFKGERLRIPMISEFADKM